jgi:competence protein ComEC
MEKPIPYQPLALLFPAAVCGIVLDRFTRLSVLFWFLCLVLALLGWILLRWKQTKQDTTVWGTVLLFFAVFAAFGFWHHDRWNRFADNDIGLYARTTGSPAAVQGIVGEMPRYYPKPPPDPGKIFESFDRTVFTLHAKQLRDGADWITVSGDVSVSVNGDCRNLRVGDSIQLIGELSLPLPPQNPGDYDYTAKLRSQRVLSQFRCEFPAAVILLKTGRLSAARWLESVRRAGVANIEQHLSPKTIPMAEGMIFGVRESVDEETTQSMIETGTLHALSISGLHVALVAGIMAFLLHQIRLSWRRTAVIMIASVLVYLLLTDVRAPAIRATALVCAGSIGYLIQRQTLAVNLLCTTALIILILNPCELFQFGTQLSFIATGCFLWVPRYVRLKELVVPSMPDDTDLRTLEDVATTEPKRWQIVQWGNKLFRQTAELFLVSFTIWTLTMPLLLQQIHLFTPVAVLVNPLLWIPLTAAMVSGFATVLLGQVPYLGQFCGGCTDYSFQGLLDMIAFFQHLGGHYWVPGPPGWWNVVFYAGFVFLTFVPVKRPRRRWLVAAVLIWSLVGIGSGYYRNIHRLWNDQLTLSIFAVGHGNCVLMTTPQSRTIVCDAGCLYSPQKAANVMSNALWRLGKTKIDAVVLSHADNDHFNGVETLADRFDIGVVFVSPYMMEVRKMPERESWNQLRTKLENKRVPIILIGDGDDLTAQGLPKSMILHPPKTGFSERENTNATSLVLRVEHRGIGFLLPGDLDGQSAPFLERLPIQTEYVMVPHHGGRSRQTEKLLEWGTPKVLLFSAGHFTHRDTTLENYRRRGYTVRSTFLEGYIKIDIGK